MTDTLPLLVLVYTYVEELLVKGGRVVAELRDHVLEVPFSLV